MSRVVRVEVVSVVGWLVDRLGLETGKLEAGASVALTDSVAVVLSGV
jgi:hypothetical protein